MTDTDPERYGTPVDRDARTSLRDAARDDVDGEAGSAPLGITVVCVLAALSAGLDLMGGVRLLQMGGPLDTVAALVGAVIVAYVWSNREYYPQPSRAERGIDSPLDDFGQ